MARHYTFDEMFHGDGSALPERNVRRAVDVQKPIDHMPGQDAKDIARLFDRQLEQAAEDFLMKYGVRPDRRDQATSGSRYVCMVWLD